MLKKVRIYLMAMLLLCLAACRQESKENTVSPDSTGTVTPTLEVTATPMPTAEPEATPTIGPLTEEEIKFFNEKFFTAETEYPGRWVRNNILYAEFTNPAQVDLEAMFYDEGSVEEISKEERDYLREQLDEPLDTSKFTAAYVNEMMQTYLGISLEESGKNGLDRFFFNAEYDAYYLMHSDAMCVCVQVESGERNEDGTITLVYRKAYQPFTHLTEKEIEVLPQYQVVLKETENGYQFLSNQAVTE